jgi:hypothetical protein
MPLPFEPRTVAQPEYDHQVQQLTDVAKTVLAQRGGLVSTESDSN